MLTSKFIWIFSEAFNFVVTETYEREDEMFDESVEMRFEKSESRFRVDTF